MNDDPTKHIAQTIIAAGWGLLELTPVKKSMEEIFVALTGDGES